MIEHVKISNIKKMQAHRYFSLGTMYNKKINDLLKKRIQILMYNAILNNSAETLMLLDNSDMSYMICSNHNYEEVALSPKMAEYIADHETTFTAIHNHPNNSGFSIEDFQTFMSIPKMKYMIVCGNNCKYIDAIGKTAVFTTYESFRMCRYIDKYVADNNLNIHSSAAEIIEYFENHNKVKSIFKHE